MIRSILSPSQQPRRADTTLKVWNRAASAQRLASWQHFTLKTDALGASSGLELPKSQPWQTIGLNSSHEPEEAVQSSVYSAAHGV